MPETKRLLKVFLCHASADKPKVRELYRYLRKRGIKPWFDEMDLVGGQDWQIEIPKALLTSDAILICLTKNSVDKEGYIQKEIKFALDKALEMPEGRIFIIPVRFEECEVPFSLSRYQWVDLFDEAGYARMMRALKFRASQLHRADVKVTSQSQIIASEKEGGPAVENTHEEGERLAGETVEQVKREEMEKVAQPGLKREAVETPKEEGGIGQKGNKEERFDVPEANEKLPSKKIKTLSKPNTAIIFVLTGLIGISCLVLLVMSLIANWPLSIFMSTPNATFTATIPPTSTSTFDVDLCASGKIKAQVEKVHRHMREFDDAATIAASTTQAELNSQIAALQRIRREAEDEPIPSCLTDLKNYQIEHMNTVITTLFEFKEANDPQAIDCTVAQSNTEGQAICDHINLAREQHDQYLIELARLLGLAEVPTTAVETSTP